MYCSYITLFSAPSFDSDAVLKQISSDESANTITVSLPKIDESNGPVRYANIHAVFYISKNVLVVTTSL